MKKWIEYTRNRWSLEIAGAHVAAVVRSRSWKRLASPTPWHVSVLGHQWSWPGKQGDNWFADLFAAKAYAEREARALAKKIAAAGKS